ncbi:MAG TPA: LysR substrate-binding domain-containing protein [Gaiellaceae bacterium]|nr:LysR substrate-binding domain-containing protein [Gaiellaceae bacterium]
MEPDSWLGVELRHFAALRAVASEGSFGRAAERLGYTQSAISQQVATLERIVGEQLVERPGGPRPVSLTDAGLLLLRHADSIVARLQAAQADLHALRAGEAGKLRVGTFQSAGARLLPQIMRRFAAQWPRIEVMLEEHDDEEIADALERGELDVGFVLLPVGDAPLETVELLRDPYVLVVAAGSPLAHAPPSLSAIAQQPLVGFRSGASTDPIEAAFRTARLEPRWAFRSNDNQTVQGLVAAGMGCAIVPLLTVEESDPRVVAVDLRGVVEPRVVAIGRHRDRYASPAARAFIDTALAA